MPSTCSSGTTRWRSRRRGYPQGRASAGNGRGFFNVPCFLTPFPPSPGHLVKVVTLNPLTVLQSARMARRGELERASETVNANQFRELAGLAVMANAAGVELSEVS